MNTCSHCVNYVFVVCVCVCVCVCVSRLQRPQAIKHPCVTLISLGHSCAIDDRYNSARVPVWDAFMDETAATAGLCFMIAAVSWELPSWVRDNYLIKMLVVTAVIRALIEK